MTQQIPPVTLIGLHVERLKKIKVVDLSPPAIGPVRIIGPNESGKSSLLDSVAILLKGPTAAGSMPIQHGADDAEIVGDFGAFRVRRKLTQKGAYLQVTRNDTKVARPQDFLDSLIGQGIAFDPFAFARYKPAQQVDLLLKAVKLQQDPREIDRDRKSLYDERTEVNRRAKALEARIDSIHVPQDVPDAEVPVATLIEEREELAKENADRQVLIERLAGQRDQIQYTRERIAKLESELRATKENCEAFVSAADLMERLLVDRPVREFTEIDAKINALDETNRQVRQKQERDRLVHDLGALLQQADDKTAVIEMYDAMKRGLLEGIQLPVEGLSVEEVGGEYQVAVNGIPLTECSASQRLKVGMHIALALNPTVRVVLIREGSLLDAESMSIVSGMAMSHHAQAWIEVVSDDGDPSDDRSFVLEEGELRR